MAVLHHAFRCPISPAVERQIGEVVAKWEKGEREALSAMALRAYPALKDREDLHAAFRLSPDGPVPTWLQPQHISPGLAAMVLLAANFVAVPNLSRSHDTNHHLLEIRLPVLGWPGADVESLVRGQPIETMLSQYAGSTGVPLQQGGHRETGGWVSGRAAEHLRKRIEKSMVSLEASGDRNVRAAWAFVEQRHALGDALAMLHTIGEGDWLVMAITH